MEARRQRTGFLAQGGRWQGPQEAEETEQARRRGLGSETAEARPERRVGPSHMDSSPLPPPRKLRQPGNTAESPGPLVCVRMPARNQKLAARAEPICQC